MTQPEPPADAGKQADVAPSALDDLGPLDVDGVGAARWGTVAWGIALLVGVMMREQLAADGRGWWVWVCVAGFAGGVVGLAYLVRRRDALRAR